MSDKPKHSKLPWNVDDVTALLTHRDARVAQANCKLVAECVNAHTDLKAEIEQQKANIRWLLKQIRDRHKQFLDAISEQFSPKPDGAPFSKAPPIIYDTRKGGE